MANEIVTFKERKRLRLKITNLSLFILLIFVSCSGVLYKRTMSTIDLQEVVIVDTVFINHWADKDDVTSPTITKQEEKKIRNNISDLLNRAKRKEKLSEWDQFRLEVWKVAGEIKEEINLPNATQLQVYDWSMKLFWHESRFDPKAKNRDTNAKGMFQVMPFVAKEMKIPNLCNLSLNQQLPYYKKYIILWLKCQKDTSKINSAGDWYMLGLYPAYAGYSDSYVFARKGTKKYKQNKGLDYNKDGIIYKGEIEQKLLSHFK